MGSVKMLGALAGDIIGSVYEFQNTWSTEFDLFTPWTKFTDDSVMTLAVAKWLIEDENHSISHLIRCMQLLGRQYPRAGYGESFGFWHLHFYGLPAAACMTSIPASRSSVWNTR